MRWLVAVAAGVVLAGAGLGAGWLLGGSDEDTTNTQARQSAEIYDCPAGSRLTEYQTGDRVFVVARTESGNWSQIRDLDSPETLLWVRSDDVELDEPNQDLPIAACAGSGFVLTADGSTTTSVPDSTTSTDTASTSTTTVTESTTTTDLGGTTTTEPATTTTTTEAPDLTPPIIADASADPNKIWEEFPNLCTGLAKQSDISAIVTDAGSGVAQVEATWTIEGVPGAVMLSKSGDTYTGSFGPFEYPTIPDGTDQIVDITITAHDVAGNKTTTVVQVRLHSAGTCQG